VGHIFDTDKGDIPYNSLPNQTATIFGSSNTGSLGNAGAATMNEEGNIYRFVSAGVNPAGTAGDYVVGVYSLPASSFDIAGRGINLVIMGAFASNTNVKTVKLIYAPTTAVIGSLVSGGTTIASGTANTAATSGGWMLEANIFKYGVGGSNTQIGLHAAFQSGNAVGALASPSLLTAAENGSILLAVTANSATTASDTTFNFLEINGMN
jgi:hypothetical protein